MPNVNRPRLQLALREWWAHICSPRVALIMLAVTVVLVLGGPFNTGKLPLPLRAAYWAGMVWGSYSIGYFVSVLTDTWTAPWPRWAQIAGFAAINGLAVALFVMAVNALLMGGAMPDRWTLLRYIAELWAVGALVSALLALLSRPAAIDAPAPALLDRLPPPMRGPILALSAEDHYTRIRTTKGEELVLITLRDAIREAAPTEGIQIHRSHWVATEQIARVHRSDGKTSVILRDDHNLPVSRANTAALREMGY